MTGHPFRPGINKEQALDLEGKVKDRSESLDGELPYLVFLP